MNFQNAARNHVHLSHRDHLLFYSYFRLMIRLFNFRNVLVASYPVFQEIFKAHSSPQVSTLQPLAEVVPKCLVTLIGFSKLLV